MYVLPVDEAETILRSTETALPNEACGLLLRQEGQRGIELSVRFTSSLGNTPLSFRISDEAIDETRRSLDHSHAICGCFHSHIVGPARPSRRDAASPKAVDDLWLIYAVRHRRLKLFRWNGTRFEPQRLLIRAASSAQRYLGHSHAAPRTPLESPNFGGSRRVAMSSGSEKACCAHCSGTRA